MVPDLVETKAREAQQTPEGLEKTRLACAYWRRATECYTGQGGSREAGHPRGISDPLSPSMPDLEPMYVLMSTI